MLMRPTINPYNVKPRTNFDLNGKSILNISTIKFFHYNIPIMSGSINVLKIHRSNIVGGIVNNNQYFCAHRESTDPLIDFYRPIPDANRG